VTAVTRTTGTKAQRDNVREALCGYGAGSVAIAAELQRRFGLRPRDAFRQAHGWTQEQVAARLNADGSGAATFTGARVSDYERWPFGGRRPTLTALSALAKVFGTEASSLVDMDDLGAMPSADRSALTVTTDGRASGTVEPARSLPTVRDLSYALPLNRMGELDETDLVTAVTERTQAFGAWSESSNVGPVTLDDIAALTRRIARDYLTEPPLAVYSRAGLLADRVFRLLQTGRQQPDQTQELYTWAGYLCSLLAWMAGDLGHPAAAESQARTAWTCTEPAGDPTLRAWVLSTMSKIYLWDQRFEEAADAAARGVAERPLGSAAVMLACQEADAWAEIGAHEQAQAALTKAEQARQNAGPDSVGGLLACGVIRQHNYTGSVLLRIGQPADAIGHAEAALEEAKHDRNAAYGTTAQLRIWAAAAHLGASSVDGAAEVLQPVLALPAEQRLDTLIRRLRGVGRIITTDATIRTSVQGRELNAAITDFCASGGIRQLPT
jgi:transcriptional regulator with XRE-family HTH domain/tetratricopeptide (TPR) repeat protein